MKNFLPTDYLDDAILAEVTELGLINKSNKPRTQWLSLDDRDYCFSENQKLKHSPKKLSDFPAIYDLVKRVNSDPRTTQNGDAALVIVYNTKYAGINYHNDGEKLIDSKSSISTVTFGTSRDIVFCNHSVHPRVPQHTIQCGNHDLMIMKPGCQETLVHKVCQGNDEDDGWRVVVSVRTLSEPEAVQDPEVSFDIRTPRPASSGSEPKPTPPARLTIIAGDSFTAGLDVVKLGRRGRKNVINLSQPGSTVNDVSSQLDTYFLSSSHADNNVIVDKVLICVGSNDIRHCREKGVRHINSPLISLVEQIKLSFPEARIWLQSMVPLPLQHQYSVRNVEEFNKVLYEVCSYTETFYLDVFKEFLGFNPHRGCFLRRESLFVNKHNIHFNKFGLSLLARSYLSIIHATAFNPLSY